MGSSEHLPAYLRYNRGLLTLHSSENNPQGFNNNLCLFRCLACHLAEKENEANGSGRSRRPWRVERLTKDLFHAYCDTYKLAYNVESFPGIAIPELDKFEQLFGVNTNVYTMHAGE